MTPPLAVQDPWSRELHSLLTRLFRLRIVIVPGLLVLFTLFLLFDRTPWKLAWIAVILLLAAVGTAVEYRRIQRHQPSPTTITVNLVGMLVLQTGVIYVTGGIESPVILIYVALGLVVGLSIGHRRQALAVAAIPIVATITMAVSGPLGLFPRATPEVLGLGDGFWDRPVYVWTKVVVTCLLLAVTATIGSTIRQSFDRTVDQMVQARRDTQDLFAGRNQELMDVAATVAHELKNPLTSIQGLAQLMAKNAAPGTKEQERFDVMRREIARMATVLDEFRNFSRPLSGLSLKPAPLRRLLEEVVLLSEGSAEPGDVTWTVTADPAVTVTCDPPKVKQALLNLVQNSLDAMGRKGRVDLGLKVDGARAILVVADSGPGLAPSVAGRLFTPGVTTKERGTGIGLVVARSIAEQHGGTLALANGATGGCEATLSLPVSGPPPQEAPP